LRCLIETFGRLPIHRFVLNVSVYIRESLSCIWHTHCNTFFGIINTSGRIFFRFESLLQLSQNVKCRDRLSRKSNVDTDKTKFLRKIHCSIEMSHWGFRSTTYSPFCFEHIRLYKGFSSIYLSCTFSYLFRYIIYISGEALSLKLHAQPHPHLQHSMIYLVV
jgi:hypothetical protein